MKALYFNPEDDISKENKEMLYFPIKTTPMRYLSHWTKRKGSYFRVDIV